MHETNQTARFEDLESTNIGNGDALSGLIVPRDASDGLTPLTAPHSENYFGAIYPDMSQDRAKELAENDRRRYERDLALRNSLGGLAASGY